jgi:hypothetical protein
MMIMALLMPFASHKEKPRRGEPGGA